MRDLKKRILDARTRHVDMELAGKWESDSKRMNRIRYGNRGVEILTPECLNGGGEMDDREKANKLANLLASYEGTREEKVDWIAANLALIESEAEMRLLRDKISPTPQARSVAVRNVTIRFYRNAVKGGNPGDAVDDWTVR